jgi:hypothetical protein
VWQDDAPAPRDIPEDPSATSPDQSEDESTNHNTPPLTSDSGDPLDNNSIIDFTAITANDEVFNHDVYVRGTLFADKIRANQIEGLEVYADKLASLQQVLDSHQQAQDEQTSGAGPAAASSSALGMEFMNINLSGGLVVGGDAEFHGNAFFYRLVTFVEKTVFNNDITLAGHVGTSGQVLQSVLEPAAGIIVAPEDNPEALLASATVDGNDVSGQFSLNLGDGASEGAVLTLKFTKPYDVAPHILLTPANDKAGQVQYYVQSTPDGFKLFLLNTPPSGTSLQFNYWASESIVSSN